MYTLLISKMTKASYPRHYTVLKSFNHVNLALLWVTFEMRSPVKNIIDVDIVLKENNTFLSKIQKHWQHRNKVKINGIIDERWVQLWNAS